MKCPHCGQDVPVKTCPECGAETPHEGRFCMDCGAALSGSAGSSDSEADEGLDLDDRILCPDGTCTGIIVDGRCSECGRALERHEA
jgi:hypothetical protein